MFINGLGTLSQHSVRSRRRGKKVIRNLITQGKQKTGQLIYLYVGGIFGEVIHRG